MADEKTKKPEDEEIVGLDDEESRQPSLINKLRKYMLPAGIAAGTFALTALLFIFVFNGSDDSSSSESHETVTHETKTAESANHANENDHNSSKPDKSEPSSKEIAHADSKDQKAAETEREIDALEIDTAKIMEELDFLFWTPASENSAENLGMTPEDSVDTLNWFAKQFDSLSKRQAEIDSRENQLEKLEYKVEQSLIKLDQAESNRIIKLARLYDGMKPDEVAKLFANLPDSIVTSILPRMKPASASKILGMMPPKRAARLSTQLITVKVD